MVVQAACLKTVETCEDRDAVNHCTQTRPTFKIIDERERKKRERKDERTNKKRKEDISNKKSKKMKA